MIIFFYSSRRRHTRLQGDWSSDVCSSDLALQIFSDKLDVICNRGGDYDLEYENINRAINAREQLRRLQSMVQALKDDDKNRYLQRSEERRVGKEDSSRRTR